MEEPNRIVGAKKKEAQYFIAIIPVAPFFDEALKLKHHFQERYNSKAALNSPPHITLHMPFKWKEEKEYFLIGRLKEFSKNYSSGEIHMKGFNAFPPRVIYIDIVSNDWLQNLQKGLHRFCKLELNLFNANYKEHPFHPHLTLAFRDLKKQNFIKAWEEFRDKKLEARFVVKEIVLLKHDGKMWQTVSNFELCD